MNLFAWLRRSKTAADLAGRHVYYGGWGGYSLPRKPQEPIDEEEALRRTAYYVADYDDDGRLVRFDKYLDGELAWGDTYTYTVEGKPSQRIARNADGEETITDLEGS